MCPPLRQRRGVGRSGSSSASSRSSLLFGLAEVSPLGRRGAPRYGHPHGGPAAAGSRAAVRTRDTARRSHHAATLATAGAGARPERARAVPARPARARLAGRARDRSEGTGDSRRAAEARAADPVAVGLFFAGAQPEEFGAPPRPVTVNLSGQQRSMPTPRLMVVLFVATGVVVAAVVALALQSWWVLVVALLLHSVATVAVVGYTLRHAEETGDKPDPVTEARIEEERVEERRRDARERAR